MSEAVDKPKLEYKEDQYVTNRSGYSEFFELHCSKCDTLISYYQKDGPGELLRTYVDRMSNMPNPQEFAVDKKLVCPNCYKMLGLGYIYEKENRPAYALFQNSIKKVPVNRLRHLWCLLLGLIKG